MRQHGLFEQAPARTSGGEIERWRQGYHQVTRLDSFRPESKKRRTSLIVLSVKLAPTLKPQRERTGAVSRQASSTGSMRSAATKRSSLGKPCSQTSRSALSNGELVMWMVFTPASSRQRLR